MVSAVASFEDRTAYPVEERVGEDILQRWIVELLRPLVERWLSEQGRPSFVGADQFIYYEQFKAHRRVAPDVYVLPGIAPRTAVPSWKTWETGVVPGFAFEVVSQDWEKDYFEAPLAHGALGTQELIVFDPSYDRRRDGACWQRFSRTSSGAFELAERSNEDRVYSVALGCFLRAHGRQLDLRVRLGSGPNGAELFPTAEEAALARVAELETQLAELKATRER